MRRLPLLLALLLAVAGCSEPAGQDVSQVSPQPEADLEAGKNATTIEQWAKANPDNGKPGEDDK
ncbi:MAG: hypothetical protein KF884_01200 [Fimbriimonadaceae bacterium]|nr:hypothetical protein [Fimbriimonadaceae bacterium]QYK58713.1 MAG: hypothetical protein KF884_01200 [Fimbriimonadaceae bacterium]